VENIGTIESPASAENGRVHSPKRKRGGKSRPVGIPERCFSRPVTHHHDSGQYPIEVWSAPGRWCIRMKSGGACFYGATEIAAWTAFIKAIDPEVETVRIDNQGKR